MGDKEEDKATKGAAQLTEDQEKRALEWFNTKWTNTRFCEVCTNDQWQLGAHLVTPTILSRGALQLGGQSYPQIMLICKNCGNTKYVNALSTGIVTEEDKDA